MSMEYEKGALATLLLAPHYRLHLRLSQVVGSGLSEEHWVRV